MGYFHNTTADGVLVGPIFHIPLSHYLYFVTCTLLLFVMYIMLPRGARVEYCGAHPRYYPKYSKYMAMRRRQQQQHQQHHRHGGDNAYWNTVIQSQRTSLSHDNVELPPPPPPIPLSRSQNNSNNSNNHHYDPNSFHHQSSITARSRSTDTLSLHSRNTHSTHSSQHQQHNSHVHHTKIPPPILPKVLYNNNSNNINISNHSSRSLDSHSQQPPPSSRHPDESVPPVDDVVVSATMQELRDPGLRLTAHGTKSKPRTIWVQLHQTMLIWQTETTPKKKNDNKDNHKSSTTSSSPKRLVRGKEHQVPLVDILYVDVGKHTDALRKMENASVNDGLCFSLLTKRGSLDLQTFTLVQRDALVSCFSLVLDEVHAKDWRKIYRGPSSEYPSSIDAPSVDNMGNLVNSEC